MNLFGQVAFTQPFVRHFRLRQSGQIINVSSVGSIAVFPSMGAYSGTKAALNAFSDALHAELRPYGVRVLTLLPGYFETNIFKAHSLHRNTINSDPLNSPLAHSEVYTDPAQGYNAVNVLPDYSIATGRVGDPAKFAAAVYDIVSESGVSTGLHFGKGVEFECTRIALGTDAGEAIHRRSSALVESVAKQEPLWRSTDMSPEELAVLRRNVGM